VTTVSASESYSCLDLETGETYSVCVLAATKAGLPKLNNWPWVSQVVGFRGKVTGDQFILSDTVSYETLHSDK